LGSTVEGFVRIGGQAPDRSIEVTVSSGTLETQWLSCYTKTDANGYYRMEDVPTGTVEARIELDPTADGKRTEKIDVPPEGVLRKDFEMTPVAADGTP
jgi:hypothetical protein